MKIQKTQSFASIYLLTALVPLFLMLFISGCAERQAEKQVEAPPIDAESIFANFESLLIHESEDQLPNASISQSRWSYSLQDCELIITETLSYKRNKAPFGGFNANYFVTAWQSERRLALDQIDSELLQQKNLYLKIHILESQNLIKEESRYAEAYLAYYQAVNGTAHPASSNLEFNLISLPIKEAAVGPEVIENLKELIIHCQSN